MARFALPSLPSSYVAAVDERFWDVFAAQPKLLEASIEEERAVYRLYAQLWDRALFVNPQLFEDMFEQCDFNEGRILDNRHAAERFIEARAAEAGVTVQNLVFGIPDELDDLFYLDDERGRATKLMLRNVPVEYLRILRELQGAPLRARDGRLSLDTLYGGGEFFSDYSRALRAFAQNITGLKFADIYLKSGVTAPVLKLLNSRTEELIIEAAMHGVEPVYAIEAIVLGIADVSTIVEGWTNGRVAVEYLATLSREEDIVV